MTQAHNPAPKKALGQHWLDDTASLQAMVSAVSVGPNDTVLEIGPGPGSLTRLLTAAAGQVVAVEYDAAWAQRLPELVPAANLTVTHSDIMQYDFTQLPLDYKVVANIPYYLTSNLIRVLSETPNRPAKVALLIQKEVAERAAARPGDLSMLAVTAQFYWQVRLGMEVPAELFTPPPKVDSQILILNQRPQPLFEDVEPRRFFRLAKAGFGERRKTLRNSLAGGMHLEKTMADALLQSAGIDPGLRAQALDLDAWYSLYQVFRANGHLQ